MRELKKLKRGPFVKVGFPAESSETGDLHTGDLGGGKATVVEIAIFHEFGTVNMPERSFIRSSFDERKRENESLTRRLAFRIYGGMSVEKALDILGIKIINDQKRKIQSNIPPITKEGGTMLIDTGQMINSITFVRFKSGGRG